MKSLHERLQEARRTASYETPAEAAEAFGWKKPTYWAHENGSRGLTRARGKVYADAFKVEYEWLMTGKGSMRKGRDDLDRAVASLDASQRPKAARLIAEIVLGVAAPAPAPEAPARPPLGRRSSSSR